jgi:hypothetical protein
MSRHVGLDLSASPPHAAVVELGSSYREREVASNPSDQAFAGEHGATGKGVDGRDAGSLNPGSYITSGGMLRVVATFPLHTQNGGPSTSAIATLTGSHSPDSASQELSEALLVEGAQLVDGSTAVIAPDNTLDLHVTLPFQDRKRVAALLPQELEDLLPFPANDFVVGLGRASSLDPKVGGGGFRFPVQIAPKTVVKDALGSLSAFGLDPNVVTSRSSLLLPIVRAVVRHGLLGELVAQAPEAAPGAHKNAPFFVVVPYSGAEADLAVVSNGEILAHTTSRVTYSASGYGAEPSNHERASLASSVLLELGGWARRFGVHAQHGFIVTLPRRSPTDGGSRSAGVTAAQIDELASLRERSGLRIGKVELEALFPAFQLDAKNFGAVLAALCSPELATLDARTGRLDPSSTNSFTGDSRASTINLRTGEFAYRPPMHEVIRALKRVARPIAMAIGTLLICALGFYLFRAQEISRLENRIAETVRSVAPQIVSEPGRELSALSDEAAKMELELKDIGTSDSSSPLELYVELTKHFPQLPDTTVDRVSIRGNRLEIRGCAPSYRVIEQIENALTKVKLFSRIKKGSGQSCSAAGGGSGSRGFTFEVTSRD